MNVDKWVFPDEILISGENIRPLERLRGIMHRLRAPGGCPWDAEQTHASLVSNLIEGAYETVDAIRREDWVHLEEELGDLLLQVVFHRRQNADFDEAEVGSVVGKMIDGGGN